MDLELPQIIQPATSALIVTSLAVPIRCVMGFARHAVAVGYVWIPVHRNLSRELQYRGPPVPQNLLQELHYYLLMGGPMRTVCGPHVPPLKSSVKSYFPTSNADSDSRFEFYAKKHVQT